MGPQYTRVARLEFAVQTAIKSATVYYDLRLNVFFKLFFSPLYNNVDINLS